MIAIVEKTFTVGERDIDELEHVNNQVYLRWLEEVARHASDVNGWTWERYRDEVGAAWMARQHWIEYLRPCALGDTVTAYTWLQAYTGARCLRRYAIKREGKICCVGATEWNFVNLTTRRAMVCPDVVISHFEIVPADDERLKELCISRPMRFVPEGLV